MDFKSVAAQGYGDALAGVADFVGQSWRMVITLCLGIEIAEAEDEKFLICYSM